MTTKPETRYARVTSSLPTVDAKTVAAYLPANYRVATDEHFGELEGIVIIEGEDEAGWTLDDYIIPRLASGLMTCVEQFVHMEDDGDGESGPHLSVWLEDEPMSGPRPKFEIGEEALSRDGHRVKILGIHREDDVEFAAIRYLDGHLPYPVGGRVSGSEEEPIWEHRIYDGIVIRSGGDYYNPADWTPEAGLQKIEGECGKGGQWPIEEYGSECPSCKIDDGERCAICGESVPSSEMAEMHDASMLSDPEMFSEAEAGIVHAECGIAKGWQVS